MRRAPSEKDRVRRDLGICLPEAMRADEYLVGPLGTAHGFDSRRPFSAETASSTSSPRLSRARRRRHTVRLCDSTPNRARRARSGLGAGLTVR